ncbi:hypothetical protein [Stutzerimonas stutzeri]|nr:hypothetical protein [Stutzerimonas stutzeri]
MSKPDADRDGLERYDKDADQYLLVIITDEDHASQIEPDDGQVAWR